MCSRLFFLFRRRLGRTAFVGVAHFSVVTNASVLGAFAAVFLVLGAYSFSRIQI
jgi:hypothetical protein